MTSCFHRLIALTLAVLVLVTSTGWSMDLHYCQGNLKGASFIGKARTCHDKEVSKACHKKKKACHHNSIELSEEEKNACCQNRVVHVKADDTDKVSVSQATLDYQHEYAALVPLTDSPQIVNLPHRHSPQKYRPPPLNKDLQVLLQIFRL